MPPHPAPPCAALYLRDHATAKQAREDRLLALSAGVDIFLTRPLDGEDRAARLQVAERILSLEQSSTLAAR